MKKTMLAACLVLAGVVSTNAIAEETVTGQNWVGYVKLPTPPPGQIDLIAVNFEAVGANGAEQESGMLLSKLFNVEELVEHPFEPTLNDQVYIWNPDPENLGYDQYYYQDGSFWSMDPGTGELVMDDPFVYPGQAMWFQSAPAAEEDRALFALGQVKLSDTADVPVIEGLQLVGNPYPTVLDLNKINWNDAYAHPFENTLSDQIHIYDREEGYVTYYLDASDGWTVLINGEFVASDIPEIDPGHAFWYSASSDFSIVFERGFELD